MVAGARYLRGVAGREQHSAVGVVGMKIERRPLTRRELEAATSRSWPPGAGAILYLPTMPTKQISKLDKRGVISVKHDDELAEKLVALDRQIKALRRFGPPRATTWNGRYGSKPESNGI